MKATNKRQIKSPQPRAHYILWNRELPFGPKTAQNKLLYKRHSKHRAQDLAG